MDYRNRSSSFYPLLGCLLLALTMTSAYAQQPSSEQLSAIRGSCRSDYMANCSSVRPGGAEALQCLERNIERLTGACKTAVSAVMPQPAAPAASPEPAGAAPTTTPAVTHAAPEPAPAPPAATAADEERLQAVQKACTLSDFATHCSWIAPNSPEVLRCLEGNAAYLSPACRAAVNGSPPSPERTVKPVQREEARPAPRPPEPPAAAAAAHHQPSPRQLDAIRASCRSDFMSHCRGVTPGGAEALECLKRNAAALSSACRSAVAAIGGGAPAGTAAAAPEEAPAVPAVAPLQVRPFILPQRRLAIMAMCHADKERLCANVPPIGSGVFDCLAAQAASLSPNCYAALKRISRP